MPTLSTRPVFRQVAQRDVLKIVVLTSLFFVVLHFIRITLLISREETTFFFGAIWNNLCLPPSATGLLQKPWTLLTYAFMDMSFMRILGNMIWLWMFGMVIEDLHGRYRVLPLYLMAALLGGIAWSVFQGMSAQPVAYHYGGGSAALAGVALGALLFRPKYNFWLFGSLRVPLWGLFLVFAALQVLSAGSWQAGVWVSMAAGMLAGVFYNYGGEGFFSGCSRGLSRFGDFFGNNQNFVLPRVNRNRDATEREVPFRRITPDESRIDALLDKINEKGMQALTEQEKRFLEEYSKK